MERTHGKAASSWWTGQSHICVQTNQEEQLGSKTDCTTQGSSAGKLSLKPLKVKTCGGWGGGRNSQPHKRVRWRDPQGTRAYTKPPTQESAPEGPSLLVGSGGNDGKLPRAEQAALFPLGPLPHIQHHKAAMCVAPPWQIPKATT